MLEEETPLDSLSRLVERFAIPPQGALADSSEIKRRIWVRFVCSLTTTDYRAVRNCLSNDTMPACPHLRCTCHVAHYKACQLSASMFVNPQHFHACLSTQYLYHASLPTHFTCTCTPTVHVRKRWCRSSEGTSKSAFVRSSVANRKASSGNQKASCK